MKIIGLTGGIATGKNFVADIFTKNGAAIFDADQEVHKLLESDKSTFEEVKKYFPEVIVSNKIERKILGKIVFDDEKKIKTLEKIIHPEIRKNYQKFLQNAKKDKKEIVILNIPLLLESKGYKCDKIIAIITKKSLQKERFLIREKESNPKNFAVEKKNLEKKFEQIYKKQINNLARKKAADFVVMNNGSKLDLASQINKILQKILDQNRH